MEQNHIKSTPKDVFLHLFNIVTFYLSVIGLITLYVNYINALFPDALNYYFSGISQGVRWASSVLFIAVPAYLISSWMLGKDIKQQPEKRDLKLRKWLIYFTLFVSAITMIVDLMIFVYYFLDGEISTRFFLKVLAVLQVAGTVFGYYFWELKRDNKKTNIPKILTIVVAIVVLGSIIAGFFIVGTPADQRNRRFDERRINDLQSLQGQIINFWVQKGKLPENLDDLKADIAGYYIPQDPDTQQNYEYIVNDELNFSLCANFGSSDKDIKNPNYAGKYGYYQDPYYQENWQHEAGRVCFERKIDPEYYKDKERKDTVEPTIIR